MKMKIVQMKKTRVEIKVTGKMERSGMIQNFRQENLNEIC